MLPPRQQQDSLETSQEEYTIQPETYKGDTNAGQRAAMTSLGWKKRHAVHSDGEDIANEVIYMQAHG